MAALRNINAALKSPADTIKDGTLISIIVVSVFEAMASSTRMSLRAWTEHINGASDLLKLRGRSQIQTVIGLRLFIHVAFTSLSVVFKGDFQYLHRYWN